MQSELSLIRIYYGDIWDLHNPKKGEFIVVPTNKTVKKDGCNVMGRGIALQACKKFPTLSKSYGNALKKGSTVDGMYPFIKRGIICFPVKFDYKEDANLFLIERSLIELSDWLHLKSIKQLAIPVVGAGFGSLCPGQVLPLILRYLNNEKVILVISSDDVYANEEYRESFMPTNNRRKDKRVSQSNCYCDIEI